MPGCACAVCAVRQTDDKRVEEPEHSGLEAKEAALVATPGPPSASVQSPDEVAIVYLSAWLAWLELTGCRV